MVLAAAFLASGCSTSRFLALGPCYEPGNVHTAALMPQAIRRVAFLPVARHYADTAATCGAETLSAVFQAELRKSEMFEVVPVTEIQLQRWTGQRAWRVNEALPEDFFARLAKETGCDAVMFPALTAFRAYPPLAIGLDFRLIACLDQNVIWAVDEMLDAGTASVARSAREYGRTQTHSRNANDETLLQSPTRFAQFASAALVATLPPREKSLKKSKNTTMTETRGQL